MLAQLVAMELIGSYENSTELQMPEKEQNWSPVVKAVLTSLATLFILFTTVGNMLTTWVIFRNKRLRSISNMYLASLACADMVVGSFVITFMLLYTVTYDNVWVFGEALCRVWTFVDFTCCTASLTNVCLIAMDRYRTVSQPLKSIRRRTKKGAMYNILLAWMVPTIFWATAISLLATADDQPTPGSCEVKWKPTFIVLVSTVSMMYMPILCIILLFIAMMVHLNSHMASMNFSFQRSESVRRHQSFASVVSEDAQSERAPKATEAAQPLIEPRRQPSAIFFHGSSESADTASTDYSAETLASSCSKVRSVGTNTSPERTGGLVKSVGTNTSPVLRSNNSRASLSSAMSDTRVILHERGSGRRIFRRLRSDGRLESDIDSSDDAFLSKLRRQKWRSQSIKSDANSQFSRFSLDGRWNRYASVMRAERQNSVEKSRVKQQVSAAKTLGTILGFLLLCWIPYSILCPIKAYFPGLISSRLYHTSIWVNYLNSAVNPIIYCLCNPQFRHAYSQLVLKRRPTK